MEKSEVLTVGQLAAQLKEFFDAPSFAGLTVLGEVKSKNVRKGTAYVTLIEADAGGTVLASLNVVVFASVAAYSPAFESGTKIMVSGRLNYYGPGGTVSFIARKITLAGAGAEMERIRIVYERLKARGLFAPERKKAVPRFPRRIGIVTSADGAAYRDILDTLKRRFPVSTVLFDAKVQGTSGPAEIIRALLKAYARDDLDVIILGRGGGSKSDLMAFNDENVVVTVAAAPCPVISAIGHEIDTSLADYAADVKAITPTAAATAAVPELVAVTAEFDRYESELSEHLNRRLEDRLLALSVKDRNLSRFSPLVRLEKRQAVVDAKAHELRQKLGDRFGGFETKLSVAAIELTRRNPERLLDRLHMSLEATVAALTDRLNRHFERYDSFLKQTEKTLELSDPNRPLTKGYAVVEHDGKTLTAARQIEKGQTVTIRFADGTVKAVATEVQTHDKR